jgi:mannose-1-phosphate guanylyltransferase
MDAAGAPVGDHAVLEGAKHVRRAALGVGWDDLGSWRRRRDGLRAAGCATWSSSTPRVRWCFGGDRLIAVVGVPGVVVVDTPDAVLVVARSRAQDVRRVVAALAGTVPIFS